MLEYVVVGLIGLFFLSSVLRMVGGKMLRSARRSMMKAIENYRGSRLITMIHRQKGKGLLSSFMPNFIDIEDSMSILEAIRKTPDDKAIDFLIHTPGGLVLASAQIARALSNHPSEVRVIIPHYAMSGGTLLALAADKIVLDKNAVLGPVDPQIGRYPAASLLKITGTKDINEVDDETLVLADIAEKSIEQMHDLVVSLLVGKGRSEEAAEDIATTMVSGTWTHDHPLTHEFFEELGFDVDTDLPEEVHSLMKLFPNAADVNSSVEYMPLSKPIGKDVTPDPES
jgi:ClpP class serine protease